jgi:ABC-type polysaccharide/polyol phosphate transport system ATPase subunit
MRSVFSTSVGVQAELSGRENAHLLSEFMFPERRDKRQLVEEALEFSGLGHHVDSPFRLYSNGMQARLFLSLISAAPCDILILGEVFDGADHVFAEKISARMRDTIQRSGLVLFVSHSEEQVRRLCNRLLLIEAGRLVFDGGVEEGLRRYRPPVSAPEA